MKSSVLIVLLSFSIVFGWEKYVGNPVLEPVSMWAYLALSDPSIIYTPEGEYVLVYTAAGYDSIHCETLTRPGAAWSSDGFDWTMSTGPVIMNGYPGTWDSAAVETPAVLQDGDSLILLYAGDRAHGAGELAIGIASSHDNGRTFTRLSDSPVFVKDTTRPEEYRWIESPTFLRMGDSLVMWYNAQSIDWHVTVCRATSFDGIHWNRYPGNPVMDIGLPGEFDEIGIYSPSIRQIGDSLLMIYQGLALGESTYAWDSTSLGTATSVDGGFTWTRNPDNPILGPGSPGSWDETGPKTPSFAVGSSGIVGIYWNGDGGCLGIFTHSLVNITEDINRPNYTRITAYPNPFNSTVKIAFDCRGLINQTPTVEIFDLDGRRMAQLPSPSVPLPGGKGGNSFSHWEKVAEGRMRAFTWQPTPTLGSGVYLVRATVGGQSISKRIVYLK